MNDPDQMDQDADTQFASDHKFHPTPQADQMASMAQFGGVPGNRFAGFGAALNGAYAGVRPGALGGADISDHGQDGNNLHHVVINPKSGSAEIMAPSAVQDHQDASHDDAPAATDDTKTHEDADTPAADDTDKDHAAATDDGAPLQKPIQSPEDFRRAMESLKEKFDKRQQNQF